MTGPLPQPSALVSLPQLAQAKCVPRRTLYRDLMALWNRDVAEGGGDWLLRTGRRRKLWVNLSRLKAAHPVLFEARAIDRGEFEHVRARVEYLENRARELNLRVNALGARLRDQTAVQTCPNAGHAGQTCPNGCPSLATLGHSLPRR